MQQHLHTRPPGPASAELRLEVRDLIAVHARQQPEGFLRQAPCACGATADVARTTGRSSPTRGRSRSCSPRKSPCPMHNVLSAHPVVHQERSVTPPDFTDLTSGVVLHGVRSDAVTVLAVTGHGSDVATVVFRSSRREVPRSPGRRGRAAAPARTLRPHASPRTCPWRATRAMRW